MLVIIRSPQLYDHSYAPDPCFISKIYLKYIEEINLFIKMSTADYSCKNLQHDTMIHGYT